jgi:cytochrome b pre-mRNA-processing protein 3
MGRVGRGESEALNGVLKSVFRQRRPKQAGARLYAAAVAQARQPAFYTALGVADTVEGRFELYSLHVLLLVRRLKGEGPEAAETAQALFDLFVGNLDHALRELGVGDLTVPKRMRKLGEAVYGRALSYEAALAEAGDLEAVVGRTVFEGSGADVAAMSAYVRACDAALASQDLATILEGVATWPEIPA